MISLEIKSIIYEAHSIHLEYARPGGSAAAKTESIDLSREREKLKESLLPFVKEAVQKQLKEEREYYKSRPSLAAKHMEQVFGAGNVEQAFLPRVTSQIYERIEERIRQESIRKGR